MAPPVEEPPAAVPPGWLFDAGEGDDDLMTWLMALEGAQEPAITTFPHVPPREAPVAASLDFAALAYAEAVPPLALQQLSLKLPVGPQQLPAEGLRAALFRAMLVPSLALEAALRPGCVLLTATALLGAAAPPHSCSDALEAAMAEPTCAAAAFLRGCEGTVRLRGCGDGCEACATGGVVAKAGKATSAAAALPPLAALAVALPASPAPLLPLTWQGLPPAADGAAVLRCSLHGVSLRFACGALEVPLHDATSHALRLPCASTREGAALLHRSDAAGALDAGPPRVLLLTCDAQIAAEVQAAYASLASTTAAALAALEADVYALGLALRPSCPPAAAARAAAAALARGWRAAARRLLRSLAAGGARPEDMLLPGGVTLLHVAASTGAAWAVRAVLDAPAGAAAAAGAWAHLAWLLRGPQRDAAWLLGSPLQRCGTDANATPMHAASAALALAVSTSGPGPAVDDALAALEALAVSPEGAAAWLGVARGAEAGGATPALLALGTLADAAASSPAATRLRALDAAARRRVAAGARVAAAACDELRSRGVFQPGELGAFAPAMLAAMDTAAVEADAVAVAAALLRCAADAAAVTVELDLTPLGEPLPAFPRAAAASMQLRRLVRLALAPEAADNDGDASTTALAALPEELQCYSAWLLQRSRWVSRFWMANLAWYYSRAATHAGGLESRLAHLAASSDTHHASVLLLRSWPDAQPLFWALVGTWQLLAVQTLLVAALLFELTPASLLPVQLPAAARAAARHMPAHHAVHYLLAGFLEAQLLIAAAAPAGISIVVWPMRAAAVFATVTLLSHMGLPVHARAALPLLALRAALPLAAHAGAPVWLHTPRVGVALQLAAVALAVPLVLWRDAVLRPAFRAAKAAALAEAEAGARDAQRRSSRKQ